MDRMMLDGERGDLPYIQEIRGLGAGATGVTAHLSETRYVALSAEELLKLPGLGIPGAEPEVRAIVGIQRKQPMGLVRIYPYRRNATSGVMERLTAYRLDLVEERRAGAGGAKSGVYPDHSKLASGAWYRFSVPQDGVYKLSYQFLQSLGVEVNDLASDRINVYGNHEGLLPYRNSHVPVNDLLCNAIEMVDGGDGQFGPNDHILFYAKGAQDWDYNATAGRFIHTKNTYSDSASYFIGLDVEEPKRMMAASLSTEGSTDQVTVFSDRQVIDRDLVNLLKSGRTWCGDTYDQTTTYNYNFSVPFLRSDEAYCMTINVLSRTVGTGNSSGWNMNVGGQDFSFADSGISGNYAGQYADTSARVFCSTASGANLPITVSFDKHDPISSLGWMNFLELNARRDLKMTGDQLLFRDPATVGAGRIGEFTLDLATSVHRIWEITDPANTANILFTDNGAQKVFRLATDTLREFIAFKNSGYLEPVAIGAVPNQDLHAAAEVDMVIVCPSEFQGEAQRLAERRMEEGLSVVMATPQQIYNEFSVYRLSVATQDGEAADKVDKLVMLRDHPPNAQSRTSRRS